MVVMNISLPIRDSNGSLCRSIDMTSPELRSSVGLINRPVSFDVIDLNVVVRFGIDHTRWLTPAIRHSKVSHFDVANQETIGRRQARNNGTEYPQEVYFPRAAPFDIHIVFVESVPVRGGTGINFRLIGAVSYHKDGQPHEEHGSNDTEFPGKGPWPQRSVPRGINIANVSSDVGFSVGFFVHGVRNSSPKRELFGSR